MKKESFVIEDEMENDVLKIKSAGRFVSKSETYRAIIEAGIKVQKKRLGIT